MNEEAIREMIAEAMSASTRDKAKASDYGGRRASGADG
jgi:hypothetical protein